MIVDIAVPTAIAACLLIAYFSLRTAANITGRKSFKYYSYAFGIFFLSLAFPFLMLALSFFFDSLFNDIGEDTFNLLATAPIVVGTFFLALGTRELRKEADEAQ